MTQLGNSPNPFNPITNIKYELLEPGPVKIVIYDTRGRIVKEFVDDHQSPGFHSLQWNATNNSGQPVSSGVYLYSIQSGDLIQSKKMIFLK